jgi:hypothetical protein
VAGRLSSDESGGILRPAGPTWVSHAGRSAKNLERTRGGLHGNDERATGNPHALGEERAKIYKVKRTDPSNTIFAASVNYIYDTPLDPKATPFGDSGFVVVRKSGDADFRKKRQATPAGYDNSAEKFQTEVGALPGATNGVVTPGDGETMLTSPP